MNSLSDWSQISDIPAVSRIAHSSSIHNKCSLVDQSINSIQGVNRLDKTLKLFNVCEESINDYAKLKLIFHCVQEASLNKKGTMHNDTASKLKTLLLIHESKKYMYFPSTSKTCPEELIILGITDLPTDNLTHEEQLDVKCHVEALLREKIFEFLSRYDVSKGIKEVLKSNEVITRNKLLEYHEVQTLRSKYNIDEFCAQYTRNLLRCKELLDKWNKLKYKDTNEIYCKKAESALLQARVAETQAKITKLSCIIRMFKETPITIDAFSILHKVVDKKLFAVINEIKQKEHLKTLYDDLKNTEYKDVLQNYLKVCSAIKKKKYILNTL